MENKIKKVSEFQELSKLIFLNLKKDVVTNNFISKDAFENEINQGSLYYISFEQGLFLLRDRGDFFILNYYLINATESKIAEVLKVLVNKPLIVEIVGKSEDDEKYLKVVESFKRIGMKELIERERFSKGKREETTLSNEDKSVGNVSIEDINIRYCEMADFEAICELLNSNFNKYYGCIPTKETINADIICNNFYKAILDNKIIGILHIKKSSNSSEIRHLAVDKLYRNIGVATKLLQKYDKDINVNKTVWTGKENISAQKVYEKNEYIRDGYNSKILFYYAKD